MAEAFSVPPSQIWEGNDGPWSTFALHIGTPGQQITVLPASSGSTIMATDVDYCDRWTDENLCSTLRGGILDVNSSGSFDRLWNGDQPFFELPFGPEAALGYESDGLVGLDFAGFGSTGGTDVLLPDQVVTTIASDFPWLGLLGLTARPSNITETVQRDSPLGSLVQQKTIPSSFWAYTAGAWYRKPPVYGSLTYGGYDAARGEMSNARAWKFWPNNARDLTVAVSQITVGSQSAALPGMPIYAYIDSVVPEIWLPLETCAAFEAAFGLQWNDTAVMYLVNESHHDTLVQQDASVTFVLGQSTSDPPSSGTRITLPYSAFELEALYPLAGITDLTTSVGYFPLKRASDETQYILGRTLLQEA